MPARRTCLILFLTLLVGCSNHDREQRDELRAYVGALAPFEKSVRDALGKISTRAPLQEVHNAILKTHEALAAIDMPAADNEKAWALYERAKAVRSTVEAASERSVERMSSAHHDGDYNAATTQGVSDVIGSFQSAANAFLNAYDRAKKETEQTSIP
jgi:hypothetical protein